MPQINQKPPKPMFGNDRDDDATEQLTAAVKALTAWLKANAGAATKQDLLDSEQRVIRAIRAGGGITPGVEGASGKLQGALNSLDAQVPDK